MKIKLQYGFTNSVIFDTGSKLWSDRESSRLEKGHNYVLVEAGSPRDVDNMRSSLISDGYMYADA